MSGVAKQFATQLVADATQNYVGVAVFGMENCGLAQSWSREPCQTATHFFWNKLIILIREY